jgi:hypothetical protein
MNAKETVQALYAAFAYEVADGRVKSVREYMDTRGGWLQVFDGDTAEILLEGTRPGS